MGRGRVVVVALPVLAALDAGRSLWARVGFAQPRSRWRPDPAEFAPIAWPPGVDASQTFPPGSAFSCSAVRPATVPTGAATVRRRPR